jgi:hypothetical protein
VRSIASTEQLGGGKAQLLQPGRLGGRPRLVADLGIGRPLPQPQGLLQQDPSVGRAGPGELARLPQQQLEPPGVHRVVGDPQRVARRRADQQPGRRSGGAAGLQHPPQVGHIGLQRRGGAGRRLATPQLLDHAVHRHQAAPGGQQHGEHGTLPGAAEVGRPAVDLDLDRPEHPYPHHVDQ